MKGEYPERPVVSVGAVIIHDSHALLVKRGTNPGKGVWSVPGGKVELGETLPQAVAREAHEETGMVVEPGKVVNVSDAIFRDEPNRFLKDPELAVRKAFSSRELLQHRIRKALEGAPEEVR